MSEALDRQHDGEIKIFLHGGVPVGVDSPFDERQQTLATLLVATELYRLEAQLIFTMERLRKLGVLHAPEDPHSGGPADAES